MLDARSRIVLKYLIKHCEGGAYKVVEAADIISAMPKEYKIDQEAISQIIKYLSGSDYISVKYSDDNVYCLSPLPFGRQCIEAAEEQRKISNSAQLLSPLNYLLIFLTALIASFLGTLICSLVL